MNHEEASEIERHHPGSMIWKGRADEFVVLLPDGTQATAETLVAIRAAQVETAAVDAGALARRCAALERAVAEQREQLLALQARCALLEQRLAGGG